MTFQEFQNWTSGYFSGKAVGNILISGVKKYREEIAERMKHWTPEETINFEVAKFIMAENKQGAFEYLNEHLQEEIIDATMRQNDYIYSLETIIKKRKDKYMPFYEKIGMEMPEPLKAVTADIMCEMMSVPNLHIIDSVDGKTSPSHPKDDTDTVIGVTIGIIILILILAFIFI